MAFQILFVCLFRWIACWLCSFRTTNQLNFALSIDSTKQKYSYFAN